MSVKIDDIYKKIDNMGAATEKQKQKVDPLPQPFGNVENLNAFDSTLADQNNYKSFVSSF